jgi:hypothetical protein
MTVLKSSRRRAGLNEGVLHIDNGEGSLARHNALIQMQPPTLRQDAVDNLLTYRDLVHEAIVPGLLPVPQGLEK